MKYSDSVLALGEAFARHRGLSFSTISTYAVGDSKLKMRLRSGRVTVRVVDRFVCWLAGRWPEDLGWPTGVARPGGLEETDANGASVRRSEPDAGGSRAPDRAGFAERTKDEV